MQFLGGFPPPTHFAFFPGLIQEGKSIFLAVIDLFVGFVISLKRKLVVFPVLLVPRFWVGAYGEKQMPYF